LFAFSHYPPCSARIHKRARKLIASGPLLHQAAAIRFWREFEGPEFSVPLGYLSRCGIPSEDIMSVPPTLVIRINTDATIDGESMVSRGAERRGDVRRDKQ
jgi:hypothetical protein